jgi:hypothetical protein
MSYPKRDSARWSTQKKLFVALAVLMVLVLPTILCAHFLVPATSQEDGAGQLNGYVGEDQRFVVNVDARDPQVAAEYGILGYVELSWKEPLLQLEFSRGVTWSAIMLVHFVSYSSEATEVNVCVDPNGGSGMRVGKYYIAQDGSKQLFWFSSLLSYDPSGTIRLKANEIVPVKVTVQIPSDLPKDFASFRFFPMGIAPEDGRIALVAKAVDAGEVMVK